MSLKVNNLSLLCAVLRKTFPPYTGAPVRLFRGASSTEHRNRTYGVSWTADRSTAERFARDYSYFGSVVLETLAPTAAIIAQVPYPEPITDAERQELLREHPALLIQEYHDEREFLVDRRQLETVTVALRIEGAKR
jgi:hypothetical protein